MSALRNQHGRPWEYLDAIKLRVAAGEISGGRAFTVVSADGAPLVGRYTGEPPVRLVAVEWNGGAS